MAEILCTRCTLVSYTIINFISPQTWASSLGVQQSSIIMRQKPSVYFLMKAKSLEAKSYVSHHPKKPKATCHITRKAKINARASVGYSI